MAQSLFLRALSRTWRFIDGARKVFLNVLFLLFLVLIVSVYVRPEEAVRLQGNTTLVLRPYGRVVEEYSSTPLDRAIQQATEGEVPETRLRDLIAAVEQAAKDPRIVQMVIDTNYLWGIGLSSLRDLERAVNDFKTAGKPVVAMGDAMDQHQYYLASMADEVWLHPEGAVWIDGYANIRHFFKEGLDKLAVEINLFRVGEYKSAMEPFIRDDMSPEAREASQFWLGSLWQSYLEGISRNRGIPLVTLSTALDAMADGVEQAHGDLAKFALDLGLVDRLVSEPEARQELAQRGAPNSEGDGYRAVEFENYLALTGYQRPPSGNGDISVVVAEGDIVYGHQGPGRIGADDTVEQLRDVGSDSGVKAVVLRINSPGGDALAAEKIRRQVQALRDAGKTVVVSMGDVAASGGYWIATSADEIWASPTTITGSIGVFGMIPTFGATLEKIGVHTDGVGTSRLAGKLRVDRPLDPDLRRIFQSTTEHVYDNFLQRVADARGMTVEEVNKVARGRVWSGSQAAERGLVDRLGSLQDAIDAAARIAGLGTNYRVTWYQPELNPLEKFILELTSGALAHLSLGHVETGFLRRSFIEQLLADLRMVAGQDGRFTVAAHCLCGLN